jgi:hypothetical protein
MFEMFMMFKMFEKSPVPERSRREMFQFIEMRLKGSNNP